MSTESQTRKEIIDLRLLQAGWHVSDRTQVIEEYFVSQGSSAVAGKEANPFNSQREFSDYVLLGKDGKVLAVVEAKKSAKHAEIGREQAKQYCVNIQQEHRSELPFCFYTNGHVIFFWNLGEAPPQRVHGFPTRQDLERLLHLRKYKKPLTSELINTNIAGRDYQLQAKPHRAWLFQPSSPSKRISHPWAAFSRFSTHRVENCKDLKNPHSPPAHVVTLPCDNAGRKTCCP